MLILKKQLYELEKSGVVISRFSSQILNKMNVSNLISKCDVDELMQLQKIVEKYLSAKLKKSKLSINIMELDISVRAFNCLRYNNIETLNELTCIKPSELKLSGNKSIQELTEVLNVRGLSWGR